MDCLYVPFVRVGVCCVCLFVSGIVLGWKFLRFASEIPPSEFVEFPGETTASIPLHEREKRTSMGELQWGPNRLSALHQYAQYHRAVSLQGSPDNGARRPRTEQTRSLSRHDTIHAPPPGTGACTWRKKERQRESEEPDQTCLAMRGSTERHSLLHAGSTYTYSAEGELHVVWRRMGEKTRSGPRARLRTRKKDGGKERGDSCSALPTRLFLQGRNPGAEQTADVAFHGAGQEGSSPSPSSKRE